MFEEHCSSSQKKLRNKTDTMQKDRGRSFFDLERQRGDLGRTQIGMDQTEEHNGSLGTQISDSLHDDNGERREETGKVLELGNPPGVTWEGADKLTPQEQKEKEEHHEKNNQQQ